MQRFSAQSVLFLKPILRILLYNSSKLDKSNLGQGVSFLLEIENIFGRQAFKQIVLSQMPDNLLIYFVEKEGKEDAQQIPSLKRDFLYEYPPSRIDQMIKEKNRDLKINNLCDMKAALDKTDFTSGDYHHIINFVKVLTSSKNAQIQLLSLKCIRSLIFGLRGNFPDPLSLFPLFFSQYSNNSDEIRTLLDQIFSEMLKFLKIHDFLPVFIKELQSFHNPNIKINILRVIHQFFFENKTSDEI